MTGKEALEELKNGLFGHCKSSYLKDDLTELEKVLKVYQQCYEIVKKDLEVLEAHKKIEEELSIDLITLFKFFKKEMVFKTNHKYDMYNIYHAYPSVDKISLVRRWKGWAIKFLNDYYYLKDFNKTFRFSKKTAIGRYWAMKGELEEKNEIKNDKSYCDEKW